VYLCDFVPSWLTFQYNSMEKIKNYLKNYFEKSSKFKIATDILFYLLILSLLIPSTRALIIRGTLFGPKIVSETEAVTMKSEEYNLLLEDMNGNTVQLADYSKETIFLCFWATWCPPCRAEMPSVQKLYDKYGKKIKIFLITNEERTKVENYLNEFGYDLPVYFQKSATSGVLDVSSLPTSFLISNSGQIIVHKRGAANWNSRQFRKQLDSILK